MTRRDLILRYQTDAHFQTLVNQLKILIGLEDDQFDWMEVRWAARLAAELWIAEQALKNSPKMGDLGVVMVKPSVVVDKNVSEQTIHDTLADVGSVEAEEGERRNVELRHMIDERKVF